MALVSCLSIYVIAALLSSATIISSWLLLTNGRGPAELPLRPARLPPHPAKARIAVCLVGGARQFELTGDSIVRNVLAPYPGADLFLHSPLDGDAYKFGLLKDAPRVTTVKIFEPRRIVETDVHRRVLTPRGSPMGLQGLLQYFSLVEGCLSLIRSHELQKNFSYDWIVRTRVDGFWAGPLEPSAFKPNTYVIPEGSRHGGLNDRLGIGERRLSIVPLSRLTMLDDLAKAGYNGLNSERAFEYQMKMKQVLAQEHQLRFCIVTKRQYKFPPDQYDTPVASMGTRGPLSGAKCRTCLHAYTGPQADRIWAKLDRAWVEWRNNSLGLCNATVELEKGWEEAFDEAAGLSAAIARRRVAAMSVAECNIDLEMLKAKTTHWEAPDPAKICGIGLGRMVD